MKIEQPFLSAPLIGRFPVLALLLFATCLTAKAKESFDFIERFALAEDRKAVLSELVPGTEEFYYFSALVAQQEGRFDEVDGFLEPWIKRHGETPRVLEIRHRQALLSYGANPAGSLQYLRDQLGLRFDHEQAKLDQKPDFPTTLDRELIDWDSFQERNNQSNSLSHLEEAGLDHLIRSEIELTPAQRRELLSRLRYPDYDRLVGLIAADLRTPESRGFGEFPIHRLLTLDQLDELAGLRTELTKTPAFVDARLLRLRPNGDVLLEHSAEERQAYLDRLWAYVSQLDPAFNSLKTSVLFQRLNEARKRGEFPLEEFLTYLRLPRPTNYAEPLYLRDRDQQPFLADLNADFTATTGFPPILNDEFLVRHFLEVAFITDESFQRFNPYIREDYLKGVFAETKLIHGLGDASEFFSMLSPLKVEEIKDRVEIVLDPSNPVHFGADEEVSLKVNLKNVGDLIVKVYEINSLNYYLDQQREISTDLNLDGLVANEEKSFRYDQPAMLRHSQVFPFESMKGKRGIWVVEMIGNGMSSRALIRKGKLQYLSSTTPGGELVEVLTEENEPVKDAAIHFGGKRYESGEDGAILLPFSEAGAVPVVLSDGVVSSLVTMELPAEAYDLSAGIFLEQESLIAGREASVTIRPQLSLLDEPVSISLLEGVTLRIKTTDLDGVDSVIEVNDFALFDNRESVQLFRVPARLRNVSVSLEGKIDLVSRSGDPVPLSAERSFPVNGTDAELRVFDLYLSRSAEGFSVDVLGKSGEPVADQPVTLTLRHRDFTQPFSVVLKSSRSGRITLGALASIIRLEAYSEGAGGRVWALSQDHYSHPGSIHAVAGEMIVIPTSMSQGEFTRSDLALFEIRGGVPLRELFGQARQIDGAIEIAGLDPGDYRAFLRNEAKVLDLHITGSNRERAGYALSESRHLQLSDPTPLYISRFEKKGDRLFIQVNNADEFTRVHLVATHFVPQLDPYAGLRNTFEMPLFRISRGTNDSLYVSGRDIGEEYQYILERRSLTHFPGNMLKRPGILLNPWELNETSTEVDAAAAGEAYERGADMKGASKAAPAPMAESTLDLAEGPLVTPSLQFLDQQSVVLANLKVGENGLIEVEADLINERQLLHAVAVNATTTTSRQLALPAPENPAAFRDLRLSESLDEAKSFTQQRKVTMLKAGEKLIIDDLRAAELEIYDTLGEVYATLLAINADSNFARFGFVTRWNILEESEKQKLYSDHACHELHFFLAEKDPDFFTGAVLPYLRNKAEKTFLDHYLLGDALESYLAPWEFSRLNIVERVLLGRRLGGEQRKAVADHVASLYELMPTDLNRDAFNFAQALRGRRSDAVGFAEISGGMDGFAFDEMPAPRPQVAAEMMVAEPDGAVTGKIMMSSRGFAGGGRNLADLREEAEAQALFRQIESTREWAENNYFELPIAAQNADLIRLNAFWKDFALATGEEDFYSREFTAATGNFTEMMMALAVLDLPFEGEEHEITIEENTMTLTAKAPLIVFHEEIEEAAAVDGTPILVSQNFYRADDRYRYVEGEQQDKFVTDEFLAGVVYGSQVVVTNPTSSRHRLELLVQIPAGAVPVQGSDYTKSYPLSLEAFSTERLEVSFYFPGASGAKPFTSYPVQVAKEEEVIASGAKASFQVVDRLSEVDEASWEYLSQSGSKNEVLGYLQTQNLQRIDLGLIAWRLKEDVDFFRTVTSLVASRHGYNDTLWSYGMFHGETEVAREFLKHQEGFLRQSGKWIESELVSVDPVERHWHQLLEYSPLVNARVHRLGRARTILNDRFRDQYLSYLELLSYKTALSADDQLAVSAYLFLQDRIEEGLAWYSKVERGAVTSQLQYDYLAAYASFYREDPEAASAIAKQYENHPVERWKEKFAEVSRQAAEVAGEANGEVEGADPIETRSDLDPFLKLSTVGRKASISYRNMDSVTVNYYVMDLEFLFSSKPFVSGDSGQFSYIKPNRVEVKPLPAGETLHEFEIPAAFASKNVLVEVVGAGMKEASAVYSNGINLELSERYGRLLVTRREGEEPLSKAYVKVYAKMKSGEVRFLKDGYTDLRGKFDYVSLSTNELDEVENLSLLVMSEKDGSLVREVKPPQR